MTTHSHLGTNSNLAEKVVGNAFDNELLSVHEEGLKGDVGSLARERLWTRRRGYAEDAGITVDQFTAELKKTYGFTAEELR